MRLTALMLFVLTCWPAIAVADQTPSAQQEKDTCDSLQKKARSGDPLDGAEQKLFKNCIDINHKGGGWEVVPVEQYLTTIPEIDFKNATPGTGTVITK
jgi:hypothetical protein